jgi:deoxyribonuclease V
VDADFGRALQRCLDQIPPGRVATCGVIARALGDVRAARAVATWLSEHRERIGAHRVVRLDGRPLLRAAADRLSREGTPVARNRVRPTAMLASLDGVGFLEPLQEEQKRLEAEVREEDEVRTLQRIAGIDVSYHDERMYAAAVSMDISDLEPVAIATIRRRVEFPYIPTYLAYREFPGIEAAVNRLSDRPDLLLVDGHGRLHPALFGIACHVGVRLDIPTIGIAKHLLTGRFEPSPPGQGPARPVSIHGRIRGYAWMPPGRSRAIFVSVGHRVSLESAVRIVRETTRHGYPEPLRVADRVSRELSRGEKRKKGVAR